MLKRLYRALIKRVRDIIDPPDAECLSCGFWGEYADKLPPFNSRGLCRVDRPTPDQVGDGVWPETDNDDWCGDWERSVAD